MKKGALILTLWIFISTLVSGTETGPRVAVCSSGEEKAGMIVALMEPGLSRDGNVILLDRAKVQKVLAEHNLSLAGFLSTDDALKAGQLLQCNIFSELHCEKATNNIAEIVSVVAFDAVTGVRLCDEALPTAGSIEEFAKSATHVLLKGVGKWQRKTGSPACRTVSLLSVRNVDLPPQMSGIADCIGMILERQLLRSPDVAVLERKRLDRVNKEAILTGDRRDQLLVSVVLVELDLTRRENGIVVRASLEDVNRKNTAVVKIDGSSEDIAGLVHNLGRVIVSELHLRDMTPDPDSRKNESDRLIAEYVRLSLCNRWEEARAAAEGAVALAPADLRKQEMLCNALEGVVTQLVQTKAYPEMLDLLERDITFREGWLKAHYKPTLWCGIEKALSTMISHRHFLDPTPAAQLAQLRHRYKSLWEEYYTGDNSMKREFIELWAENSDVWLEAFIPLAETLSVELSEVSQKSQRIADLSTTGKKRLMQYYEDLAKKGDMMGHTSAFKLVLAFSNNFPNVEDKFKLHFRGAADMAVNYGPGAVDYLVSTVSYPCPVFSSHYKHITILELRRLGDLVEKRKVFAPNLWLLLDERDGEGSNHPGEYLERGFAQIKDPECTWQKGMLAYCPHSTRGVSYYGAYADDKEYFAEKINKQYQQRYGKDIPGYRKPGPFLELPSPWHCVERLFVVPEGAVIRSTELDGEWIFLVSQFQKPSKYELYRINVVTDFVERVSSVEAELGPRPSNSEIAIGKQACCLVEADGLLVFPKQGGPVQVIRSEIFLPQTRIVSAQEANGCLYLGCIRNLSDSESKREGLLIRCDMDGRHPVVLASSARSEVKSALDNCGFYLISGFYVDDAKQRLIFPVHSRMSAGPAWDPNPWHNSGLWALDTKTERLSFIVPRLTIFGNPLPSESLGQPRCLTAETVLVPQGEASAKIWTPASNALTEFEDYLKSFGLSVFDICERKMSSRVNIAAVLNGDLYYSWKRISKGRALVNTWRDSPEKDVSDPIMLRVYNGKLLVCTTNTLWRMEPTKTNAPHSTNDLRLGIPVADQHSLWLLTLPRNAVNGPRTSP